MGISFALKPNSKTKLMEYEIRLIGSLIRELNDINITLDHKKEDFALHSLSCLKVLKP